MPVLVITSQNGGVGKTSMAANLGREIGRQNLTTILIDFAPHSDLSKIYVPEDHQGYTIMDVLMGMCTLEDACLEVGKNLYIVPGSKNLHHYNLNGNLKVLQDKLKSADQLANVIIIDTTQDIEERNTLAALAAADYALLVTKPEALCVENLNDIFDTMGEVERKLNRKLTLLGIAVNSLDSRRALAAKTHEKLLRTFQTLVFQSHISYYTALPISHNKHIAVRDLKWWSKTNGQYKKLALEVLERMGLDNGN